jgi:hypothetical protein
LRERVGVDKLEEGFAGIGTKDVDLVSGALIEPSLGASQRRVCVGRDEEDRIAHLDPIPDGGEEGGGVDDGDCVKRFWIVGCGKLRSLLEVVAERPNQTKGDAAEVDDGRRSRDGR